MASSNPGIDPVEVTRPAQDFTIGCQKPVSTNPGDGNHQSVARVAMKITQIDDLNGLNTRNRMFDVTLPQQVGSPFQKCQIKHKSPAADRQTNLPKADWANQRLMRLNSSIDCIPSKWPQSPVVGSNPDQHIGVDLQHGNRDLLLGWLPEFFCPGMQGSQVFRYNDVLQIVIWINNTHDVLAAAERRRFGLYSRFQPRHRLAAARDHQRPAGRGKLVQHFATAGLQVLSLNRPWGRVFGLKSVFHRFSVAYRTLRRKPHPAYGAT